MWSDVWQEVKKREDKIMERVKFMLSNHDDPDDSDDSTQLKKKKHKKREAMASSRAGTVTASRSADSKLKGNGQVGVGDAHLLADGEAYSARSGPQSVPKPTRQSLHRLSAAEDMHGSPLKPLDLPLSVDMEQSPRHRLHNKGYKLDSSPSARRDDGPMFPPIVKPVRASAPPLASRGKEEYENFSQPVVGVVADLPDKAGAAGVQSSHKKDEPRGSLDLTHVHGYAGDGSQYGGSKGGGKNVLWVTNNVIAYPAATLIVLMDVDKAEQVFFKGHSEETSSLAVHPDKRILASGEMGKCGRVLVWDSGLVLEGGEGGAVLKEVQLQGGVKGIIGLSFSGDGGLLAALGMDENKTIYVLHWEKGDVLASVKLGHVDVFQMGFNPFQYVPLPVATDAIGQKSPRQGPSLRTDEGSCCYTLISCGTRCVKFWTLRHVRERIDVSAVAANGSQFKGRQIAVPKNKQQWAWKFVLEGNVGLLPKQNGSSPVDMTCFCVIPEVSPEGALPRSRVLTGSANGSVLIWQQLESGEHAEVENESAFWLPRGRLLCVVTDVHDGPLYDIDYFTPPPIGHNTSSTTAVLHRVITCSKDGLLNVWTFDSSDPAGDASPMEHLTSANVASHSVCMGQPRSVSWSIDGSRAVVGTTANCLCLARGKGLHSEIDRSHATDAAYTSPPGDVRLDMLIHGNVGRVRRVAYHPLLDVFATIAADKTVRLWSMQSKSQVALTRVASCGTAITFTPDGAAVAVGTDVGEVLILTCTFLQSCLENNAEPALSRRKPRWELLGRRFVGSKDSKGGEKGGGRRSAKHEITELKYSPNGDVLAVAGRDKCIHFLSTAVRSVVFLRDIAFCFYYS